MKNSKTLKKFTLIESKTPRGLKVGGKKGRVKNYYPYSKN